MIFAENHVEVPEFNTVLKQRVDFFLIEHASIFMKGKCQRLSRIRITNIKMPQFSFERISADNLPRINVSRSEFIKYY